MLVRRHDNDLSRELPEETLLHILKMRLNFEQTNMAASSTMLGHTTVLNVVTVLALFYIQIKDSDSGIPSEAGLSNKVSLGFIWENPRVEVHDASEVVVDGSRDELRLTCILMPPLPLTKEVYRSRNSIVKWMKVEKTHGNKLSNTFWSDSQDITAISLSKLTLQHLGTYGCSYHSLLKTINITVSGFNEIQRLPNPTSHMDLEGAVLYAKNLSGLDMWKSLPSIQQETLGLKSFPCSTSRYGHKANSVNQLEPADIDIILSIGGAFSAGVAANANNIPGLFRSNKIHSFSVGGKFSVEELVTLPSIIKKFNPKLKGAVTQEEDFSTMHYGSSIRNLPLRVSNLIRNLQNRKDIDFDSSWKLLTISLDFHDYCVACRLPMGWDDHIEAVTKALDILHEKVPRLFVNLVLAPNVTQLYSLPSSRKCSKLFWKHCECMESTSDEKVKVAAMQRDFKEYLYKLVQKYQHSRNFTVVIQPFWTEVYQDNGALFAQDCYHMSSFAQEFAAINLWNNMVHPFLFTSANSKVKDSTDFIIDDSLDADFTNAHKSSSELKVGLGLGLSLLFIIAVVISVFIYIRKRRPLSMRDRIRILATPWKRMKEKV